MQIRGQLNGLSQAFGHRSLESSNSHTVHKVSVGTFALLHALQQGAPFGQEAARLRTACPDDPLIIAILDSLPHSLADQVPLPTALQLPLYCAWTTLGTVLT